MAIILRGVCDLSPFSKRCQMRRLKKYLPRHWKKKNSANLANIVQNLGNTHLRNIKRFLKNTLITGTEWTSHLCTSKWTSPWASDRSRPPRLSTSHIISWNLQQKKLIRCLSALEGVGGQGTLTDSTDAFKGEGVQGQKADVILEYVFTRYSCMKIVHIQSLIRQKVNKLIQLTTS